MLVAAACLPLGEPDRIHTIAGIGLARGHTIADNPNAGHLGCRYAESDHGAAALDCLVDSAVFAGLARSNFEPGGLCGG
jgi:hypothetical protein